MEREQGVTGPQRLALRVIGCAPGICPKEIAETLHIHPSTLTGILRRLEERRLLTRTPHPRDGRMSTLSLSARGRALNRPQLGLAERAVAKTLRQLKPSEILAVERALTLLASHLDE